MFGTGRSVVNTGRSLADIRGICTNTGSPLIGTGHMTNNYALRPTHTTILPKQEALSPTQEALWSVQEAFWSAQEATG